MSGGSSDRWPLVKRLFQAVLDRSPAERESYLDAACGEDPVIRADVESLLAAHDDPRPFLDAPAVPGAARVVGDLLHAQGGTVFGATAGREDRAV